MSAVPETQSDATEVGLGQHDPSAIVHPRLEEPSSLTDARARVDETAMPRLSARSEIAGVSASLFLTDVIALLAAVALADVTAWLDVVFGVVVVAARVSMRLYRKRLHLSVLDELPRALGSVLAAGGLLLVALSFRERPPGTPLDLLLLAGSFTAISLLMHTFCLACARIFRRRFGASERTLIIGAGRVGSQLAETLLAYPELGLQPVAFADPDSLTHADDLPLPVVSTNLSALRQTLRDTRATTAIMAFSAVREAQIVDAVITAHQSGCAVLVVPRMFELHHDGPDVERIRGVPLIRLRPDPTLHPTWWIKRSVDVIVGWAALLLLSPLLLVLGAAVLLESGRPVLFWQERVGLDGGLFRLAKFRSMRPLDEHESRTNWSIADDPRVGPVGRFLRRSSLDELAQLWNIARGDMSLVGPRPERPTFVELFKGEHERYWARHRVPVGLTGLAQVNGLRGDTSIRERARYDNYYIANWSLWLDLKIMLLTVREVVRGGGGR